MLLGRAVGVDEMDRHPPLVRPDAEPTTLLIKLGGEEGDGAWRVAGDVGVDGAGGWGGGLLSQVDEGDAACGMVKEGK